LEAFKEFYKKYKCRIIIGVTVALVGIPLLIHFAHYIPALCN